jgi:xanthine dehydrogenase accessory factor
VDEFVSRIEDLPAHLHPATFAIVASMGKYDEAALLPLTRTTVAFVGLVASRKRAQSVFAALREDGVTDAQIGAVRNPVGIDIAASTPEEIALSIMSEVTRVRRTTPPPGPAVRGDLPSPAAPVAIDPVCHMEVPVSSPLQATHAGSTYYFCSDSCRRKFSRTPARFLG